MLWKINVLVISALIFTIFAGNLCAQQIAVTEEDDRPGFRNIYLGMTRAEVENALEKDASISAKCLRRGLAKTRVGPYPITLALEYDNHGILYRIGLFPHAVTADKIETTLQKQVDFFYGVFRKRFGEPTYTRPATPLSSPKEITLFDFKDGFHVHLYRWVKDNTARYISLLTYDFKYRVTILIVDKMLREIKEKEDEKQRKAEREGVLDDF